MRPAARISLLARSRAEASPSGGINVPIAVQATTFDLLNGGDKDWGRMPPYWELGWQATQAAGSGPFELGTAGGGYGATTATFKGGLGSASAVDGVRALRSAPSSSSTPWAPRPSARGRISGPRPARWAPSSADWASPRTCRRRR